MTKRSEIMRYFPVLVFAVLLMASSVFFQNCAGYSANSSILTDDSSIATTDSSCAIDDLTCSNLNNVQIEIANQDPVLVRSTTSPSNGTCDATNCVDIAGYCDVDGYGSNKISASIAGTVNLADTVLGSCDANGRFRILLPMPAGFVMGSTYTVTVILRIYDASGAPFENPTGLNRKTINLTSAP